MLHFAPFSPGRLPGRGAGPGPRPETSPSSTIRKLSLVQCLHAYLQRENRFILWGSNLPSYAGALSQSPVAAIEIGPTWNGGTQSPNSVITIRSTTAGFERSWDSVALAPENNLLRISARSKQFFGT